jgi:hypothetical protein
MIFSLSPFLELVDIWRDKLKLLFVIYFLQR